MHFHDIRSAACGRSLLSYELFPPRNPEAVARTESTIGRLAEVAPDFASVTYGAGGGRRDFTLDFVGRLMARGTLPAMPHLTCLGHREDEIAELLELHARHGVGTVLALRGDPPNHQRQERTMAGDFAHAVDLVRFIRRFNESGIHPDRRGFAIGAACFPEGHPATPNRLLEMDHLKAKVDAGVDFLVTQAFFVNHDFHDFRARCELAGIRVPILAGILPLPGRATFEKMASLAGGMRYPATLQRALARAGSDEAAFRRVAVQHAVAQCADLLDEGVDGLHFYTLNQAEPTLATLAGLGLLSGTVCPSPSLATV